MNHAVLTKPSIAPPGGGRSHGHRTVARAVGALYRRSWASILLVMTGCSQGRVEGLPICEDPSPHVVHFVEVEPGVRLEVLEWGATGTDLILLTGLTHSAHVFDGFAPRLTPAFRVYVITRRGYGASSQPEAGYTVGRLAADVVAVLDSLRLERVALVGHSIAGDELTEIASTYPDRVSKLVYLDAAYDRSEALEILQRLAPPETPPMSAADSASPLAVQDYLQRAFSVPFPLPDICATYRFSTKGRLFGSTTPDWIDLAILEGVHRPRYEDIEAPALAIYALGSPEQAFPIFPAMDSAWQSYARMWVDSADALVSVPSQEQFRQGVADGQIVELLGATHYVYVSHEAEVLRLIRNFLR